MSETWDYVIVGGGICGLSLGALLANDGRRVLILEQSNAIGGRARVVEKDGFTLDWGIHTIRFGSKSSLAKTLETISEAHQAPIIYEQLGIGRFFLDTSDAGTPHWELFPTSIKSIFKGKYFSPKVLLGALGKVLFLNAEKNLAVSVADWQKIKKLRPKTALYLKLITSSMQVCPFLDRASVGELKKNLMEVIHKKISVTYPVGGWKLIFDRLTAKITQRGGQILTNTKVQEILVENHQAVGMKHSNGIIRAKNIVYAAPTQVLFDVLNPSLAPPDFVNYCKNMRPTAGISLDVALKKKISEDNGLFYINDPIAFGFFTSNIDTASAPANKQLFTIFAPCNVEEVNDLGFRNEYLARLRAKLFKAFPDMEQNLEFERPIFLPMVDGAEVNTTQHAGLRPHFQVPGIQHLYLVGDSTAGAGAGGDIGHNAVWDVYELIQKEK